MKPANDRPPSCKVICWRSSATRALLFGPHKGKACRPSIAVIVRRKRSWVASSLGSRPSSAQDRHPSVPATISSEGDGGDRDVRPGLHLLWPVLTQLSANHLTSFPLHARANSGFLLPVFNAPRYPTAAAWLENLGAVNRPWK